jgi:tetratricopeptide (TPR) repeat protein
MGFLFFRAEVGGGVVFGAYCLRLRGYAFTVTRFMTAISARFVSFGIVSIVMLVGLAGCPSKARQESIDLARTGDESLKKKEFEEADNFCKQAVDKFRDNQTAWWCLGRAKKGKSDWAGAADAFEQAVRLDDKNAMYHMWLGISLYEKAIANARRDIAARESKTPDQVIIDFSTINSDQPIQQLQQAVTLNADLYEAHYQLGRIFRNLDKSKEAADSLTKAIMLNPRKGEPYVALSELYMRWDYVDQAIQVAAAGAGVVQQPVDQAKLEYELGLAYYSKRLDDKAIEAFTKALASKKDMRPATFQRGAAYFRKGNFADAKKDLEDFTKNGGSSEFEKNQASKMLLDILAASSKPR